MIPAPVIRHFLITFFISVLLFTAGLGQASSTIESAEGSASARRAGSGDALDSFNTKASSEDRYRIFQMTGPFGGDVSALAIDPRDPDRILIGTGDGQIFRSTDGGTMWKRLRPGIRAAGFTITVLLFDREKFGVLYVGVKPLLDLTEETTGDGLFLSEDDGETWRALDGMKGRAVRSLVQSTKEPNVLVAAARNGIYRSLDRGNGWERITPVNDPELTGFHSVAIDPRDANMIYVGTHHLPWKTDNGGQSWKRAGSKETGMIDDSDIMAIHIDESNPDIVLMSACSGIYRSTDGCAKWTKIQGIPYSSRRTHVIYQHPTRPEVNFAGTTEGLWISTNSGKPDSWRRVTSLRLVINAIAIHPSKPERVFLGTEDNGVLISNDGGETYESSNTGFINRHVRAVVADRKEPGRVYSGVIFDGASSGFFVSEDGGLTWRQSMDGMGVRDVYSIQQMESNPRTIYAGTNHGLFRSDDQGRSWFFVKKADPATLPPEEKRPAADPASAPRGAAPPESTAPAPVNSRPRVVGKPAIKPMIQPIVQANAGAKKAAAKPRISRSTPSTSKGKGRAKGLPKPAPKPVDDTLDLQSQVFAVLPLAPRTEESVELPATPAAEWLIAWTWDGLFLTRDEARGWKPLKIRSAVEGDPTPPAQPRTNVIATTPHAPGAIFVGTEEGLFVSRDNGASFKLMPLDEETIRVRCIAFDPRTAETVYVGTTNGFLRSFDGGQTWEKRGGGMPMALDVSAITVSQAHPDDVYLSDELRGAFYHSKDRGRNWERIDIGQLPSLKLLSLSSDPFDPHKLYAGSFSGGVYVMSRK
ncbi:MAG: YCF48-related protein [Blastocatellia bacterium]